MRKSEQRRRYWEKHWWRDLRFYLAAGLFLWLIGCGANGIFSWIPLACSLVIGTIVWVCINAKKWRVNLAIKADENRRRIEQEEERRRHNQAEEDNKTRIREFQKQLGSLTSPSFAKRFGYGTISVHYLEGKKEHHLNEEEWGRCHFVPANRPKFELIEVTQKIGDDLRSMGMFIRWESDIPHWTDIEDWDIFTNFVYLVDGPGERIPLHFETKCYTERLTILLNFLDDYTSVSDFLLKTGNSKGIEILKAMRTTHGSPKLGWLRIFMQLGVKAFREDKPFRWEELLDMDPDPRSRARRQRSVKADERRPVHEILTELAAEMKRDELACLLSDAKVISGDSATLSSYEEAAVGKIFRELEARNMLKLTPVDIGCLTFQLIGYIRSCQQAA